MISHKVEEQAVAFTRRLWAVLRIVIVCTIALFFVGFALRGLKVPGAPLVLFLGVVAAAIAVGLIFVHLLLTLAGHVFNWGAPKFPRSIRIVHCILISGAIAAMLYTFYYVATRGFK